MNGLRAVKRRGDSSIAIYAEMYRVQLTCCPRVPFAGEGHTDRQTARFGCNAMGWRGELQQIFKKSIIIITIIIITIIIITIITIIIITIIIIYAILSFLSSSSSSPSPS